MICIYASYMPCFSSRMKAPQYCSLPQPSTRISGMIAMCKVLGKFSGYKSSRMG